MPLCRIVHLRHRLCADIFVRRREVGTGKIERHSVTGVPRDFDFQSPYVRISQWKEPAIKGPPAWPRH
jgi:hypothetical protein